MKDLIGTAVVKCTLADGTEVLTVTVEAGTALEAWRTLRDQHAVTGLWPFLVDPGELTFLDRLPLTRPVREIHRGAAEIFARSATFGREVDDDGDDDADLVEILTFDEDLDELLTDEPEITQTSAAAETTAIGLIAAEWGGVEIPGLVDWDGALTMSGLEHTAVMADWRRRFGAELMTMTGDRIELYVPRPPIEVGEVTAVTMEQAGYCPDVLFQCWESVTEMAEWQTNSLLWCFWWD